MMHSATFTRRTRMLDEADPAQTMLVQPTFYVFVFTSRGRVRVRVSSAIC